MANKTWRLLGTPGPGINEVASGYERADRPVPAGEVTVRPATGGTIRIQLAGVIDSGIATRLRNTLVRVLLRARPDRLVLDLAGLTELDAICAGTIVAACQIAGDYGIEVVMGSGSPEIAGRLRDAGLPATVLSAP